MDVDIGDQDVDDDLVEGDPVAPDPGAGEAGELEVDQPALKLGDRVDYLTSPPNPTTKHTNQPLDQT